MVKPAIDSLKKLDEVSEWNQAKILFFRQDQFMIVAHDYHLKASPEHPNLLLSALDAFRHSIAPLIAAWEPADRKKMFSDIEEYQERLDAAIEKGSVSRAEFMTLKQDMMKLFYFMYAAQQKKGLGVPLGKTADSELAMKKLVGD